MPPRLPTEAECTEFIADALIRAIQVPLPQELTADDYCRLGEVVQARLVAHPQYLRSMIKRATFR